MKTNSLPLKVIIVGNLGGDPELKEIGASKYVCNFSVATSEEWLDKTTNEKKSNKYNAAVFKITMNTPLRTIFSPIRLPSLINISKLL
jgi:hypothetical protein